LRLAVLLLLELRSLLLFDVMLLGASNSFAPSLKAKSTSSAITSASKSRLAILRVQTVSFKPFAKTWSSLRRVDCHREPQR